MVVKPIFIGGLGGSELRIMWTQTSCRERLKIVKQNAPNDISKRTANRIFPFLLLLNLALSEWFLIFLQKHEFISAKETFANILTGIRKKTMNFLKTFH